ncbi:MAG: XRE family transcriptional regulator [Coriobacteriia bacterium]|nr:XRE family transcriptional regulator [Coriobacteriia bacterium]
MTGFKEIGLRISGLREACDIPREELARDLGVPLKTYEQWEETGADIPISAIYHIASRFGVDLTELLTGDKAHLDTYQVVKAGQGLTVDRYPGYQYRDLAWRFGKKVMQPLHVILDPSDEPAALVTHSGQEFNLVLSGIIIVSFDDKEFELGPGDSIYFNPRHPHGQRCGSDVPAEFVTIIIE